MSPPATRQQYMSLLRRFGDTSYRFSQRAAVPASDVKQEIQHIAILDHIFLAFLAPLAGFLGALLALVRDEVIISDGLGADEAAFEVGVDHAGRLRRGVALVDGP